MTEKHFPKPKKLRGSGGGEEGTQMLLIEMKTSPQLRDKQHIVTKHDFQ